MAASGDDGAAAPYDEQHEAAYDGGDNNVVRCAERRACARAIPALIPAPRQPQYPQEMNVDMDMDQAWSSVAAMEAAITDGTAMHEYEDSTAADAGAPHQDDAYVPPEMPHVGAADAAVVATSAASAAAGGETGGAAPATEQAPVPAPRTQPPMIAVETLATLPEVVKLAPGYRIEDGTKFPWWFTAHAHNSAHPAEPGAEPVATVDRILMYPLVEGPDYDVGWYARYFYTFGTSRTLQPSSAKGGRSHAHTTSSPFFGEGDAHRAFHLFGPARTAGAVLHHGHPRGHCEDGRAQKDRHGSAAQPHAAHRHGLQPAARHDLAPHRTSPGGGSGRRALRPCLT